LGGLRNLSVHASTNSVLELNDGDLRTETRPNRAHLETNNTTTNDSKSLGNLLESESTSGSDNSLLINLNAGERSSLGTGGNNNVLSLKDGVLTTFDSVDLNLVLVNKRTSTLKVVDLVLLEKNLNTLGQTIDRCLLSLLELVEVDLDIRNLNTSLLSIVKNLVVEVSAVEESLGGNAADVQAGTTKGTALLNASGLKTKLGSLDGSDIATGATADNDDIMLSGGLKILLVI
jgi:hypothetical protein